MFTGIVEATGSVTSIEPQPGGAHRLEFSGPAWVREVPFGASVAVDGVCLTAVAGTPGLLAVDVVPETLRLTNLGALEAGERVNLERAVAVGSRLDGHLVQGHVDGLATVLSAPVPGRRGADDDVVLRLAVPAPLAPFVARKGSVALDGVSLTVAAVSAPDAVDHWLEVALIPQTLRETTLGSLAVGERVNLEIDVLARYAHRLRQFEGRPA